MPRGGPMLTDRQWEETQPLLSGLRKSEHGGRTLRRYRKRWKVERTNA